MSRRAKKKTKNQNGNKPLKIQNKILMLNSTKVHLICVNNFRFINNLFLYVFILFRSPNRPFTESNGYHRKNYSAWYSPQYTRRVCLINNISFTATRKVFKKQFWASQGTRPRSFYVMYVWYAQRGDSIWSYYLIFMVLRDFFVFNDCIFKCYLMFYAY